MSTTERPPGTNPPATPFAGRDGTTNGWQTRVFLQPIAAPSILGLAGFSVATMMVGTIQAGWWGSPLDFRMIWPFCLAFGGVAQFLAGMWAYRARDAVATLAHGTWGAFWMAFGILYAFISAGAIAPPPTAAPLLGFGLWFIGLAYITFTAALGSLGENLGVFSVLITLACGSGLTASGLILGGMTDTWTKIGGWLFVISAGLAWYTVTAMILIAATGRTILPTGELRRKANVPGQKPLQPIELEWAEPGVKMGQ